MKKIVCLTSLLCLCACDIQRAPKCWNPEIKKDLLETLTYDNEYKVLEIRKITEIPTKILSKNTSSKDVRLCTVSTKFSNAETHDVVYKTFWGRTQNGKKAMFIVVK